MNHQWIPPALAGALLGFVLGVAFVASDSDDRAYQRGVTKGRADCAHHSRLERAARWVAQ